MKNKKILFIGFMIFALILVSGCNIPVDDETPGDVEEMVETLFWQTQAAQQQIETIVAQTMTAMPTFTEEPSPTMTETSTATLTPTEVPSPTETPTESPTLTATLTPTVPATVTLTVPMVEVSVATNCRTGPGRIFDQVSVLGVGKRVEVVARNLNSTYWVINNPGGSGTCWLWGEYATVTGPTATLPVWDSPLTPTPAAGITPTPVSVSLVVSVPTNCRIGPGRAYEIVSVLPTGKRVTVLARHATVDFWVIENPGGSGECWVWGEHATLTGPASNLPVREAPPTPTPAVGITPTPVSVSLVVSVPTNCRVGPGRAYEIVSVLPTGKQVAVLARHATADFWVIDNPGGPGECWVWGEHATLSGPASSLPIRQAPPTPTPKP